MGDHGVCKPVVVNIGTGEGAAGESHWTCAERIVGADDEGAGVDGGAA